MTTDKLTFLEKCDDKLNDIRAEQEKYLRQARWTYSCDNPLARWFWEKNCFGKDVTLDFDDAIAMQKRLEAR